MTSYPCDDEVTFRAYGCKAKGEKQPVEQIAPDSTLAVPLPQGSMRGYYKVGSYR